MPDDLERFTNTIARQLRGEPAPLEDPVIDRTDDLYLRALGLERRAQLADDEDEQLEDEPAEGLDSFVDRAAAAMGFSDDRLEVEEAEPDADPGVDTAVMEAELFGTWLGQLNAAQAEAVRRGSADDALAAFAVWVEAEARRAQFEEMRSGGAPADGSDEADVDEVPPANGAQVAALVFAHADQIARDWNMSPEEYLIALASSDGAAYRQWAAANGWPVDTRPGYRDMPRHVQTRFLADDLERSFTKLASEGRHIE